MFPPKLEGVPPTLEELIRECGVPPKLEGVPPKLEGVPKLNKNI